MNKKCSCIVTSVLKDEDGKKTGGFAVLSEGDENCYIPASIVSRLDLIAFDEITAIVTENNRNPENTPWFVTNAQRK